MLTRRRMLMAALALVAVAALSSIGASAWQDKASRDRERRAAADDRAQVALEYRQDILVWHQRLDGCDRSRTDRTSIALALRAQSTYLNLVLDAASVKQDVKTAARVAQLAFDTSATDLESRTGENLACSTAYPKPPTPAGVAELP